MEFIENGKVIQREQDEKSKNCRHEIISGLIEGTRYRYCKDCGMSAHADGSFAYWCGSDYCRCAQ